MECPSRRKLQIIVMIPREYLYTEMIGKTNICHPAFVSLRKTLEIFLLHLLDVTSTAKICFILDTPPSDNFQFQMYNLFLVHFLLCKTKFCATSLS